jgi:uncharacterized protein (DUF1015 family)
MRIFPVATFTPNPENAGDICCTTQAPDLAALARHPDSYLRVVKPQFVEQGLRPGTDEFLQASAENFNELVQRNVMQIQEPAFWFYKQTLPDGTEFSGWIVGVSALDYEEGKIKKHENTIKEKENRLAKHIGVLKSVAEPVLLAASLPIELKDLSHEIQSHAASFSFSDVIGRKHEVWKIVDSGMIDTIRDSFTGINALYIADGHHRTAASSLYVREAGLDPAINGVMAFVMDKKSLSVKSFHRLITVQAPAWKLEETCRIKGWNVERLKEKSERIVPGTVLAHSADGTYLIRPQYALQQMDEAASLDVARLETEIFPALFGIENSRVDSRISFLRGDTRPEVLNELLNEGKVGWIFEVAPNTMEQIQKVADAGLVMPPKSTWVEPKLMTGMMVMRYP